MDVINAVITHDVTIMDTSIDDVGSISVDACVICHSLGTIHLFYSRLVFFYGIYCNSKFDVAISLNCKNSLLDPICEDPSGTWTRCPDQCAAK